MLWGWRGIASPLNLYSLHCLWEELRNFVCSMASIPGPSGLPGPLYNFFHVKLCWKPLQCFKYGNCSSKDQKLKNGRPFLLSVPTTVRHEKINQSGSAGLRLRYPRNNSHQLSSQMLKVRCTGPSLRAHCKVFQYGSSHL